MGKAMDKKNVIYGEQKSQPLAGWNRWAELATLLDGKVGPKETINWNPAKEIVKKAVQNPRMKDAYLKVGVIGTDLVFRVKEKKFLGDIEEDAILVRGYPAKAEAWAREQDTPLAKGRQIVLDLLAEAKDRRAAWGELRTLGAKEAELEALDSHDQVLALLKKLDVDTKIVMHLLTRNELLSDKGRALGLLEIASKPGDIVKLLGTIGISREAVDALSGGYPSELFEKDLRAAGVGPVTAKRVADLLVDAEPPTQKALRKLAAARTAAEAIKELAKLGVPVKTMQGWREMAVEEDIVKELKGRGVEAREALRVAALLMP